MSIESARDFLSKLSSDELFRKRLGDCPTSAGQLKFARDAGFDFTGEELKAARNELQDVELDTVSGGGGGGGFCEPEMPSCQEEFL